MLNVNVIADDSRRSEFWIVPDLMVALFVLSMWFGARWFILDTLESQSTETTEKITQVRSSIDVIEREVEAIGDLNQQLEMLKARQRVLQLLNDQQVVRYRPIILMDLMQAAKPQSLWFESIDFFNDDPNESSKNSWPRSLRVIGRSADQNDIANFVQKLTATAAVPLAKEDPRTQLYFDNVRLVNLVRRENIAVDSDEVIEAPAVAPFYQFIIECQFQERAT